MEVRWLDITDDASAGAAHAFTKRVRAVDRPWWEAMSADEWLAVVRREDPLVRFEICTSTDAGELVGLGSIFLTLDHDLTVAWLETTARPDERGRAATAVMVDLMIEHCRGLDRSTLLWQIPVVIGPDVPQPANDVMVALEKGFTLSSEGRTRLLALPVREDRLDALDTAPGIAEAGRYSLMTCEGLVPGRQQASYCEVLNRLEADAPSGDVHHEVARLTPEVYRENRTARSEIGFQFVTTMALDGPDGDVVGLTEMWLPGSAPRTVWQQATIVGVAHRGHGLGMALKVATIRHLQTAHPGRTQVLTGNDDDNRWMLAINEALGFEIRERLLVYRRDTGDLTGHDENQ